MQRGEGSAGRGTRNHSEIRILQQRIKPKKMPATKQNSQAHPIQNFFSQAAENKITTTITIITTVKRKQKQRRNTLQRQQTKILIKVL